jgi:UDP-2,3-diacylglucosamine hydrolase
VHLLPSGREGSEARSAPWREFLSRAARLAEAGEVSGLYILGDLFDYWLEPGGRVLAGYMEDCACLRRAVERGLGVVVLPGNRDFLLGGAFERETGALVGPESIALRAGDASVLLAHGDGLNASWDRRFAFWRRITREGAFRRLARGLPAWMSVVVARALRGWSVRSGRERAVAPASVQERAAAEGVAKGYDVVVLGHFHDPGERVVRAGGREGRLVVLGTWDASPGAHAEIAGATVTLVR